MKNSFLMMTSSIVMDDDDDFSGLDYIQLAHLKMREGAQLLINAK